MAVHFFPLARLVDWQTPVDWQIPCKHMVSLVQLFPSATCFTQTFEVESQYFSEPTGHGFLVEQDVAVARRADNTLLGVDAAVAVWSTESKTNTRAERVRRRAL